jgi:hypothetical protein
MGPWPDRFAVPELIRQKLEKSCCLSLIVEGSRFRVVIKDQALATVHGYQAIVDALRNFSPTIEKYKPYSWLERRYVREDWTIQQGYPVWLTPLTYERQDKFQDIQAFDTLFGKIESSTAPMSLAELRKLAETSFIETRPDDFNWRSYYA